MHLITTIVLFLVAGNLGAQELKGKAIEVIEREMINDQLSESCLGSCKLRKCWQETSDVIVCNVELPRGSHSYQKRMLYNASDKLAGDEMAVGFCGKNSTEAELAVGAGIFLSLVTNPLSLLFQSYGEGRNVGPLTHPNFSITKACTGEKGDVHSSLFKRRYYPTYRMIPCSELGEDPKESIEDIVFDMDFPEDDFVMTKDFVQYTASKKLIYSQITKVLFEKKGERNTVVAYTPNRDRKKHAFRTADLNLAIRVNSALECLAGITSKFTNEARDH